MLCRNCGEAMRDHSQERFDGYRFTRACNNHYTIFQSAGREFEGAMEHGGFVGQGNFEGRESEQFGGRITEACSKAYGREPLPSTFYPTHPKPRIRTFESGATRDTDDSKFDYEGFLSPKVLERFAAYMHENRKQSDGSLRSSDNWQKGIPQEAYMKSLLRHVIDVWMMHRAGTHKANDLQTALCAVIFNAQGYLFEELK